MAESERYLAFLQAEAGQIGKELSTLGSMLQQSAEMVRLDSHEYDIGESVARLSPDQEAVVRIIKLTNDIRTTLDGIEKLRNQVVRLGI
jgi:hypothetical protein